MVIFMDVPNGAKVLGISDKINTKPSHFELLNLKINYLKTDRHYSLSELKKTFFNFKPDYVYI